MKVFASKEVIVSGGTFNTPQLLKLSGIGPKAELTKLKIPVIANLPGVGSSLQDHYEIDVISLTPSGYSFFANCTFGATPDDPCLAEWKAGTGPYASSAFPMLLTKISSESDGVRDIFGYGGPLYFTGFQPVTPSAPPAPAGAFTFGMVKSRAKNKAGTVTLRSTDPLDTPLINFNYFKQGGDDDLQALADAVALARKVFASVPAPGQPQIELYPGRNVTTPEQIKTFIKNEAYSHHACCTSAIGADNDAMAVLDSAFRVRGVKGLRVVDGSVFPQAPGSFPVLATFLVSEKAADAILADA
jgi:choline dehydrogenase